MKVQKLVLVVWPDGAWYASDDLPPAASALIAKGGWYRRRNGNLVAEVDRSSLSNDDSEVLCGAVIEIVRALRYA